MEPGLLISVEEALDGVIVRVEGEIDLATSTGLQRAIDDLLDRDPPPAWVRAELDGVRFMDTTGVAVLLATRARAEALGTRLVVSTASPFLKRVFDVTGIGRLLRDPELP